MTRPPDDHDPTSDEQAPPPRICDATTAAGDPCRARALHGGDKCWNHGADDELARRRTDARRRGGHNRSNAARARAALDPSLGDVLATLHDALTSVHRGDLDPRTGTALASVASAIVRVHEVAALEARIAHLEDAAARRREAHR